MKKFVDGAIAEGADGIAWATGDQTKDLYDLSKKLSEISWTKTSKDSGIAFTALDLNGKSVISKRYTGGLSSEEVSKII